MDEVTVATGDNTVLVKREDSRLVQMMRHLLRLRIRAS